MLLTHCCASKPTARPCHAGFLPLAERFALCCSQHGACATAPAHPAPAVPQLGLAMKVLQQLQGQRGPFRGVRSDLHVAAAVGCPESKQGKAEKLLNSLGPNFQNQERKFKISWHMHTGGKKTKQNTTQPDAAKKQARNPFTKDGKFFYTLFQKLSSIKI